MYQTALLLAGLSALPTQGYYGCSCSDSPVRFVTASAKGSTVTMRGYQMSPVVYEETRRVQVKTEDGTPEFREQRITLTKLLPITVQQQYQADKVRFLDNEKAKVPAAIALARLENETAALAVYDERAIDSDLFALLKPGTLIVIVPNDPPARIEAPKKYRRPTRRKSARGRRT